MSIKLPVSTRHGMMFDADGKHIPVGIAVAALNAGSAADMRERCKKKVLSYIPERAGTQLGPMWEPEYSLLERIAKSLDALPLDASDGQGEGA